MAENDQISPELALVDPELRSRALAELARTESTRVWAPYAPVRLAKPELEAPVRASTPPLLVAACVYLAVGIVQVAFWGFLLMSALIISISAAVLLG